MTTPAPESSALFTTRRKVALALTAVLYLAGGVAIYRYIDKATLTMVLSLPLYVGAMLLGLSVVNYAVRSWRWVYLSHYLRLEVPASTNVLYYLAGYCLTATPGKAGEAVRLWFLKSGDGIPYSRSLPLMLADRIVDVWAMLLLTLISISGFAEYRWQAVALVGVVVLASVPFLFPLRFQVFLRLGHRLLPRLDRLWVKLRRVLRSMDTLRGWRSYGVTLLPSVAGWMAEGAALAVVLPHLGAPITVMQAVFVFSFSMIVGAISMLPGGLGSTEVTMVLLLKTLGVDFDTALVGTAIIRVTTFWFAVVIGVILMPVAMGRASERGRALRLAEDPAA